MSEDWKNKDIQPYLKDKPANWSDTDNDWVAFKGNEKLEKELASIKQKQTEILERLDKPIDTQVTGSNVELIERKLGYEVAAGSKNYPVKTPPNKYDYVVIAVGAENPHDFSLYVTMAVSENGVYSKSIIYEEFDDDFVYDKKSNPTRGYTRNGIQVIGDEAHVRVVNNSDTNQKYDVHVWGVL